MTSLPAPKKTLTILKWWFWFLIAIIIFVILLVGSIVKTFKNKQLEQYKYLEENVTVQSRTLRKTIASTGQIVPDQKIIITSPLSGKVENIFWAEGDEVTRDDKIIRVSGQNITAPFDGRVITLSTFVDDQVNAGQPIVEYGFRTSHIEFFASDSEVWQLKKGQKAELTYPGFHDGNDVFRGEVLSVSHTRQTSVTIGAEQNNESGYRVTMSVGDTPELLRTLFSFGVDIEIEIEEKANVLSLEPGAIQRDDDGRAFVYLPVELTEELLKTIGKKEEITEVLTKKDIETGFEGDDYTEITKGLKEGDQALLFLPSK